MLRHNDEERIEKYEKDMVIMEKEDTELITWARALMASVPESEMIFHAAPVVNNVSNTGGAAAQRPRINEGLQLDRRAAGVPQHMPRCHTGNSHMLEDRPRHAYLTGQRKHGENLLHPAPGGFVPEKVSVGHTQEQLH